MRTGLRSKLVLGCPLASVLGTCRVHPTSDPQLHQRLSPTQSKAAGCQHFFFLNIREMITICPRFWEPREQQDICMKASEGLELFSVNYGFPFNRYLFLNIYLIYNSIH